MYERVSFRLIGQSSNTGELMHPLTGENYYTVSEIKLSYHSKIKAADRPQIRSSQDSYEVFRTHWEDDQIDFVEQAKVLLLNQANRVLGICNLSSGCINSTVVDARMVFAAALKSNASKVILAHNHPSENLQPSETDRRLTTQLKQAGEFMSIPLLDHLIVTRRGYYSFTDDESYFIPEPVNPRPTP